VQSEVAIHVGRDGLSEVDAPLAILPLGELPPMLTLARLREALEQHSAITTAYLYRTALTSGATELVIGAVVSQASAAPRVTRELAGALSGQIDAVTIVVFPEASPLLDAVRTGAALYMMSVPLERDISNSAIVGLIMAFLGFGPFVAIGNMLGFVRQDELPDLARRFTEPDRIRLR
jgi:hypothetical protein